MPELPEEHIERPRRVAPSEGPYLEVEMPERFRLQFRLPTGDWMDEATCARERFERLADGSYLCSEFSSGLWIRCIADWGDQFDHVDGTGKTHRYRILSAPLSYDVT